MVIVYSACVLTVLHDALEAALRVVVVDISLGT